MGNENQTEHALPEIHEPQEQDYNEESQSVQPSKRVFTPVEAGLVSILAYAGFVAVDPTMRYGAWGIAAWLYFNKKDAVAVASIDIEYATKVAKEFLTRKQHIADIKPGKWSSKEGGKLELDNEGKPKWWVISCRNQDTEDMYIVRVDAYNAAVTGFRTDDGMWTPELAPKKASWDDMFRQRMIHKEIKDAEDAMKKK